MKHDTSVLWLHGTAHTDNYILTQTTLNESKLPEQIFYNEDIIQES